MAVLTPIKQTPEQRKWPYREGDYIIIKRSLQQDRVNLHVYISGNWGTNWVTQNQIEWTGETENLVTAGYINSALSTTDQWKITKCMEELNSIKQQGLIDI